MNEKEINDLINKKILEAKLDIADKRFNHLIIVGSIVLTLFGAIFPFWLSSHSSDKVDKSLEILKSDFKDISGTNLKQIENFDIKFEKISDKINSQINDIITDQSNVFDNYSKRFDKESQLLENKFKELAGTQLRKPLLICKYNNQLLENTVIQLDISNRSIDFALNNIGDAQAKIIRVLLYLNSESNINIMGFGNNNNLNSDEKNYSIMGESNLIDDRIIDPKESRSVNFTLDYEKKPINTITALLKVYYGQPEPMKCYFKIQIK